DQAAETVFNYSERCRRSCRTCCSGDRGFAWPNTGHYAGLVDSRDLCVIGSPTNGNACTWIAVEDARHRFEWYVAAGYERRLDGCNLDRLYGRRFHHKSREARHAANDRADSHFANAEELHVTVFIGGGDIERSGEVGRRLFVDDVAGGVIGCNGDLYLLTDFGFLR